MTQNDQKNIPSVSPLCPKCQKMYGNVTFDSMCSACYKKQKGVSSLTTPQNANGTSITHPTKLEKTKTQFQEQKIQLKEEKEEEIDQTLSIFKRPLEKVHFSMIAPKQKGKCASCKRKTGFLGHQCKHCSQQFCKVHRLPEEHECGVDFISLGRKMLKTENPQVKQKKIQQI